MNIIEAIILGLAQGLTEFIPVSSSGHLLLLHNAFGIQQASLNYDVALHVGTLLALVVYFHRDIRNLAGAFFVKSSQTKLARLLAVATVPAVIAGVLLQDVAETTFRSPGLVSLTLAAMALVMIVAEKWAAGHKGQKDLGKVSLKQSILIGSAQAVALIPGVSRSGSTITTGLFVGLDRLAATRFSFLLSIPITFGAILKVLSSTQSLNQINGEPLLFVTGIVTAFASGMFAIRFLLRFVAKHSLNTFAYYRLALAAMTLLLLQIF